jgi:hypothetical protein
VRFAPALFGLIIPLISSLVLVVAINRINAYADTTFQICVNGKFKMVSDYEGYRSQKTCINEDCDPDLLGNNSRGKVN